ncbi:MAG: hypothetical protein ACU0AY_00990 [Marinibacterium profundimaris]
MEPDEVKIEITLSRAAYEKAARLAKDAGGPAGELAGLMTTEEFVERLVEIALEE